MHPNDENSYPSYLMDEDYWKDDLELKSTEGWSSSHATIHKDLSYKAFYRKLQKWNLPEGTIVNVSRCRTTKEWYEENFEIIIKKK